MGRVMGILPGMGAIRLILAGINYGVGEDGGGEVDQCMHTGSFAACLTGRRRKILHKAVDIMRKSFNRRSAKET